MATTARRVMPHAINYNLAIELYFSNIVTILSLLSHLMDLRRVQRYYTVFIVHFGMTGWITLRNVNSGNSAITSRFHKSQYLVTSTLVAFFTVLFVLTIIWQWISGAY